MTNLLPPPQQGNVAIVGADGLSVLKVNPDGSLNPSSMPAIIQKANAVSTGSVASLAKAFASNNVVGNSIIVVCGVGNGTAPTVTDSLGNTYTQAAQVANGTAFNTAIFYAVNVLAGANTVTVNNGGTTASIAMEIYEVASLIAQVQAQPDQTAVATGTSGFAATPSLSALTPNEIAFAAVGIGTAAQTITVGSGWTNDSGQLVPTTPAGLFQFVSMSQFLGSLKAVTPEATFTSEPWAIAVASFRPVLLGIEGTVTLSPNNTGFPVNLPVVVQKAAAASTGSVTTLAKAFAQNNQAGNSIIVVAASGSNTAMTVADSLGNTYTSATSAAQSTTTGVAIFYAVNIAPGANTVTLTCASSSAAMEIYEVSGLIAQIQAQPDVTATANNAGSATALTAVISPSSPNEIAFAAIGLGTAAQTITVGSGWTNDSGQQNPTTPAGLFSFVSMSQFLGSLKNVLPQATFTSEPWAIAVASFRPVVVGIEGSVATLPPYPAVATAVTADSGNVAAGTCTATIPAVAGKTAYISGFLVTAGGATGALLVTGTITGIITGTQHFTYAAPAGATVGATPLAVTFPYPVPASAQNTAIAVALPTLGAGNTNTTICAYGFYL